MEQKTKVVVQTEHARIEKVMDTRAEAVAFKNQIEAGRKIVFYSIGPAEPVTNEPKYPEGYQ